MSEMSEELGSLVSCRVCSVSLQRISIEHVSVHNVKDVKSRYCEAFRVSLLSTQARFPGRDSSTSRHAVLYESSSRLAVNLSKSSYMVLHFEVVLGGS